MNNITELLGSIFALAVSVAIVAVLVSKKSQTPAVIQSWFSGNTNLLATAVSPVTGSHVNINTSYPDQGLLGSVGDVSGGYDLGY